MLGGSKPGEGETGRDSRPPGRLLSGEGKWLLGEEQALVLGVNKWGGVRKSRLDEKATAASVCQAGCCKQALK